MCRGISQSRKGVAGMSWHSNALLLTENCSTFPPLCCTTKMTTQGKKKKLSLSHILLYVLTFESCCQFLFLNYSMDFLSSNQESCYLKYDSNGNIFRKSVMPQVKSSLFDNHICSALLLMSGTEIKKLCYVEQKTYTDTPRVCIKLSS